MALMEIKNLHVHYVTQEQRVLAVNGIDLKIEKGEVLGLVGETGAGKTTTALAMMQLVPDPPGIIVEGDILFQGKNIVFNTDRENERMRGNGISMIFQDPMTALNPIMTVGDQLLEVIQTHQKLDRREARRQVVELLQQVGVKEERLSDYPHQFSGGMKQRVVIAMALLCNPELLIADEPTTALDVTIQAQVLEIMKRLQRQMGMSMMLITHDLGVVAEVCDQVAIMYAGEIVEEGSVEEVYTCARHPYTRGLFESLPDVYSDEAELRPIPGNAPNPADLPTGCKLHPRCRYAKDICAKEIPPMRGQKHRFQCHFDLFKEVDHA